MIHDIHGSEAIVPTFTKLCSPCTKAVDQDEFVIPGRQETAETRKFL